MRPNIDQWFLTIAKVVARRSTCQRLHVGALLTIDNRIISHGYNGTAAGDTHCCDWPEMEGLEHHEFAAGYEIHAEMNAILFAAANGIKIKDATLYLTCSPCVTCAKAIVQAGIKRVVFAEVYDRSAEGMMYLQAHNLEVTLYDMKGDDKWPTS